MEARRPCSREDLVGLVGGNLADKQVPPADLAAVRLKWIGAAFSERELRGSSSSQARVIDHELVVEPDGHARADLEDAQGIPFAERLVGQHERVFAGGAGAVVPEAADALIGAEAPLAAAWVESQICTCGDPRR